MRHDDLADARSAISAFLEGTGGDWDWDDYVSAPVSDAYLDSVRRLCLHLPDMFPPEKDSGDYCSPEGLQALRVILDRVLPSNSDR